MLVASVLYNAGYKLEDFGGTGFFVSETNENRFYVQGVGLKECLPSDEIKDANYVFRKEKLNEGFKTSAKVQYVARTGNFVKAGKEYTGVLRILKTILSYDYLWNNVRVKGGAYGCMSGFGRIGD